MVCYEKEAERGRDMIFIRQERPEDIGAIRILNERAFVQPAEASIVDRLR